MLVPSGNSVLCPQNFPQNLSPEFNLVAYIGKNYGQIKLRPDHKLVYMDAWERPESRIQGVQKLMGDLVKIAA